AVAVGAAGLVEAGPSPDATAQHLVRQPAVEQEVQRRVGRAHLHRPEDAVPLPPYGVERGTGLFGVAVLPRQPGGFLAVVGGPEEEDDLLLLAGRYLELDLQGGTGIEGGAGAAGQADAGQRLRGRRRAVAAEELGAVGRRRVRAEVDV